MIIPDHIFRTLTRDGYLKEVVRVAHDEDISYRAANDQIREDRERMGLPKGYTYNTVKTYLSKPLVFIGNKKTSSETVADDA